MATGAKVPTLNWTLVVVYRTVVVEHVTSAEVDWYDCAIELLEHSTSYAVTDCSVETTEV